ncbi:DUF2971 domain-containing protein [Clostridium chromiireducens]|uniref:DUF2971 domain-containing protein n=1 Tax=Clostridium chromiireducens TaxID=225345 RepID=A0A399IKL3_9CLOT|nr:DUF2971 domain-containing protein [Clostridium chromiireducens]RII33461.1 DUF2971 domain-containing protein [Clostridium chromiireducens]
MDLKEWEKRIAERNDITTHLIHLTKPYENGEIKILKEKKLIGSSTESGFVVGDKKAVCFQESPLYSLTQNIYFEQKLREEEKSKKIRYVGCGLLFKKTFVYKNQGRPVIYDKTEEAKKYLPKDQWWKIVNLNLGDENKIIDWSHEREWRVPDELEFELSDVSIIVPSSGGFKKIIEDCKNEGIDLINDVRTIINLADLFY